MGRIVIAAYRPKAGRERDLERLIRQHHQRLAAESLVTDRPPVLMRSRDGVIVEVFEWRSADAIAAAHRNPAVQRMWAQDAQLCDYVPLASLPESATQLAEFAPMGEETGVEAYLSP